MRVCGHLLDRRYALPALFLADAAPLAIGEIFRSNPYKNVKNIDF
jgi:hypothetical protein